MLICLIYYFSATEKKEVKKGSGGQGPLAGE